MRLPQSSRFPRSEQPPQNRLWHRRPTSPVPRPPEPVVDAHGREIQVDEENDRDEGLAPVGDGPYTTHVAVWRGTGLFLDIGAVFSLVASGIAAESPVSAAAGGRTPDGDGGDCDICIAPTSVLPASRYAPVGKIGTGLGDEFFVGSSFSGTAQQSGFLFLAFNDSNYFDNSGFFTANTVAVVAEPTTVSFLFVGLLGVALEAAVEVGL